MSNNINFWAVVLPNLLGITVYLSVAAGHSWWLNIPTKEKGALYHLFFTGVISCVMSPLSLLIDGKSGTLYTILLWISNTWIYGANLAVAISWHALVSACMGINLTKLHRMVIAVPVIFLLSLLILNVFVPIAFSLENNTYQRTGMYWIYMAVEIAIALDALVLYVYLRRTSGKMKFFPVAALAIPALVGIAIQSMFYGISAIYGFYAISFGCVATALQNEFLFRDQLTGLYNRFYLTTMQRKLSNEQDREVTAMMLDINGFKAINDAFGHKTGDAALIDISQILQTQIREMGTVIRYAGDEFIIILLNPDEDFALKTISNIRSALVAYNRTSEKEYSLSVSIGYCRARLQAQSMDELMDRIDRLMYEDKREYYERNAQAKARNEHIS